MAPDCQSRHGKRYGHQKPVTFSKKRENKSRNREADRRENRGYGNIAGQLKRAHPDYKSAQEDPDGKHRNHDPGRCCDTLATFESEPHRKIVSKHHEYSREDFRYRNVIRSEFGG